jgi:hypothetical protein
MSGDRDAGALAPGQRRRIDRLFAVAVLVALSATALVVAAVFLTTLRHPGGGSSVTPATHPADANFLGAPGTQPGDWEGGNIVCPLAAPNRYLPPRSGCVSALRVDVDGDGRPDLVLLYAHLSHRRFGGRYAPTAFTLEVVRATGGTVRTRIPAPEDNASLVEAGNVNGIPGAELFVQVGRISSGSSADLYTFHAGRLVRLPVILGWGGDSATRAGFACRAGRPPVLIERSFELQGSEYGRWQQIETVYAWHGAALRRISRRATERRGPPPAAETSLGGGCGALNRATTS